MTFLPIVTRELRLASRRRGTYWLRVATAGVGLVIFSGVIILHELSRGALGGQVGSWLFTIFSWLAFVFAASAGVFFTSDCLSEEKREGTLGLLFLTDLRGYDVVFGKLLAGSLRGTYGLLAAFPVIGLSFFLGGVTGGEFARLVLVLLNTLFLSLVIGVFVSAISRDTQRALSGTLVLCLVFVLILPLIDALIANVTGSRFVPRFSLASPSHAFIQLKTMWVADFWRTTGVVHLAGWCLLVLSCVLAPRSWQEKASLARAPRRSRWGFGSEPARTAWRARLFAINPVRWLAARDPWMGRFVMLALLVLGAIYAVIVIRVQNAGMAVGIGYPAMWLISMLFTIWVASHASRFFVDAARAGLLELLLASPLPAGQIVAGQWWALLRNFLLPASLILAFRTFLGVAQTLQITRLTMTTGAGAAAGNANLGLLLQQAFTHGFALVNFLAGLLAIAWFGMWMGLTTRKPNGAVLKTIAFVTVLPWFALIWVQGLLYAIVGLSAAKFGTFPFWIPPAVSGMLTLGVNITFFLVARRKLADLRTTFAHAQGAGPPRINPAPLRPAPLSGER